MTNFDFTLIVGNVDPSIEGFEDRFFEAGCDDATIALMNGHVALCFDRDARDFQTAVFTAYEDVLSAGSLVLRFEPDFLVSASEIATRAKLSRAAVSLYARGERADGFPAPYANITTNSPLWDWVKVSAWLCRNDKINECEFRHAQVSRVINFGSQFGHDLSTIKSHVMEAMKVEVANA
jgi:hypothetical protein